MTTITQLRKKLAKVPMDSVYIIERKKTGAHKYTRLAPRPTIYSAWGKYKRLRKSKGFSIRLLALFNGRTAQLASD